MDYVERLLKDKGLMLGDQRPPLAFDPDHPFVKKVNEMEEELRTAGMVKEAEQFKAALNILRLSSIYDIMDANIPKENLTSAMGLLEFYVQIGCKPFKNQRFFGEMVNSIRRLVTLSVMMGYTLRALETDGRWEQFDKL